MGFDDVGAPHRHRDQGLQNNSPRLFLNGGQHGIGSGVGHGRVDF